MSTKTPRSLPVVSHRGSHEPIIHVRFWAKVDASAGPTGCWLWTGARFPAGYGAIKIAGRPWGAHRVAWELVNGPIPDGLQSLHRCDNPPCVNPLHLFLGSQADNARDMVAKGRSRRVLTSTAAAAIRGALRAGAARADLAGRHGVHITLIDKIAEGRRWREEAAS